MNYRLLEREEAEIMQHFFDYYEQEITYNLVLFLSMLDL